MARQGIVYDIMCEFMYLLEDEWLNIAEKLKIALEATFYILAFMLALRGEVLQLIE
jgi:hypothetical protein